MFGAILKATNSSFQKGITFCRIIYVKKVMKLLAFIFEQPSYSRELHTLYFSMKANSMYPDQTAPKGAHIVCNIGYLYI